MSSSSQGGRLAFASAASGRREATEAVTEAATLVREQLAGSADLALLFVSPHHAAAAEALAPLACDLLGTENLLGCTGEAIVATGRELEDQAAVSLWAARLPGAGLHPMHLAFARTREGGTFVGWPDGLPEPWPDDSTLLLVGDPYSFPADVLLERLNEDRPGVPVVGGMASGASEPGDNRLFFGRRVETLGAVGVLLSGLKARTVVSQGCRPIGRPYVVTGAERNVVHELGGIPALQVLLDIYKELPVREQKLMQSGLHLGRVVQECQDRFGIGDFLVRNVLAIDRGSGAIEVGDYIRLGQTVQFHIRDAQTADDDLRQLLAAVRKDPAAKPAGGLLFTCNGRGTRLFDQPHHDAACIAKALGDLPLAGFFAAGELGPIAGKNFMHGFTASLVLFEDK